MEPPYCVLSPIGNRRGIRSARRNECCLIARTYARRSVKVPSPVAYECQTVELLHRARLTRDLGDLDRKRSCLVAVRSLRRMHARAREGRGPSEFFLTGTSAQNEPPGHIPTNHPSASWPSTVVTAVAPCWCSISRLGIERTALSRLPEAAAVR
jgi:hypothetical protein